MMYALISENVILMKGQVTKEDYEMKELTQSMYTNNEMMRYVVDDI